MSVKSLRSRLKDAQEQARLLQHRLDAAKDAKSPSAMARERQAQRAHKDGTSIPIRHSKSSAKSVVLFAGQTHGDVAVSGLKPMVFTRVKSGVK